MKHALLAFVLSFSAASAFAGEEPVLKCQAANFARTVSTESSGDGTTINHAEVIPFEVTVGKNKVVEMGGEEDRFIIFQIYSLKAEQSVTGLASYLVDATLVSKTLRSTPGEHLPTDIITRVFFYVSDLKAGLHVASDGRTFENSDGKKVVHKDLVVTCAPQI
jgi:hypothetical protein